MWHLVPAILYLACVQGLHYRQPNNPYPALINNDRTKSAPSSYYTGRTGVQKPYNYVPSSRQYPDFSAVQPSNNYPAQRQHQYIEESYYNAPAYNNIDINLRQPQTEPKPNLLDLDFGNNDLDMDVDPKISLAGQSYFEDLELIENFGNYLKRQTQLDGSSTAVNSAARQYNALLAVLIALARVVRNSCANFDQVYDQVYPSIVDTYYKHGLINADKVAVMIEDYIRKGYSHMPKIMKLKQEICDQEHFCSLSVDNRLKSSPLLYRKELETLQALSSLARSYYSYIEEFNQATQKGSVLPYLQNSKDRLREYVMHAVNSVEHVSDKTIRCA